MQTSVALDYLRMALLGHLCWPFSPELPVTTIVAASVRPTRCCRIFFMSSQLRVVIPMVANVQSDACVLPPAESHDVPKAPHADLFLFALKSESRTAMHEKRVQRYTHLRGHLIVSL